jgi:hypothetical protein
MKRDLEAFFLALQVRGEPLLESMAEQVARYLEQCSGFPDLWLRFRGELCHLTTQSNWTGIQADGEIEPSGSGHRNWQQPKGRTSRAHESRAVALFDLSDIESRHFEWGERALETIRILMRGNDPAIWLTFNREKLPLQLERVVVVSGKLALPFWETHHRGSIPIAAVAGVYELSTDQSRSIRVSGVPYP